MVEPVPAPRPRDDDDDRQRAEGAVARRRRLTASLTAAVLVAAIAAAGSQVRVPSGTLQVRRFAPGRGDGVAQLARPRGLPYFIAVGERQTGFRPGDQDLAAWAFEMWARQAQGGLALRPTPEEAALIRLYWVPLSDTTFGEMRRLMVGDQPGAAVYVRADLDALGADIAGRAKQDPLWRDTIVFLTCLHELGHAFGLPHTADDRDIMYSFGFGGDIIEYFMRYRRKLKTRADMRTVSGLSDVDVQQFRKLYPAP